MTHGKKGYFESDLSRKGGLKVGLKVQLFNPFRRKVDY
jgi:hypothetical protein